MRASRSHVAVTSQSRHSHGAHVIRLGVRANPTRIDRVWLVPLLPGPLKLRKWSSHGDSANQEKDTVSTLDG